MSLFLLLLTLILSDPYEILAKTELQKNWGQKIYSEFSLYPLSFMFCHFFVKLFFPTSPKWRTFERVMKTSQPCRKILRKSSSGPFSTNLPHWNIGEYKAYPSMMNTKKSTFHENTLILPHQNVKWINEIGKCFDISKATVSDRFPARFVKIAAWQR